MSGWITELQGWVIISLLIIIIGNQYLAVKAKR